MTKQKNVRNTAAPIGRIICINTAEEVGLLYQWNNGDTQVALYSDYFTEELETHIGNCSPVSAPALNNSE